MEDIFHMAWGDGFVDLVYEIDNKWPEGFGAIVIDMFTRQRWNIADELEEI